MYDYEDNNEDLFGDAPTAPAKAQIDFRAELNDDQYAAVTAPDGPAIVLAGAGSGKTRTLTYRVAYLLTQGALPEEILLLTFTNKASREMLDRVEHLTGVASHQFLGGTFHHVGGQVLRSFGDVVGLPRNYTILDDSDSDALLSEIIRESDPDFLKKKDNPKPKPLKNLISFARNVMRPVEEAARARYPSNRDVVEQIAFFAEEYRETKLRRGLADYDDLLELWLKVLESNDEAATYYQNRFRHILVDEYQDVNVLQASIVDKIAANHQIMAVGDDAQCIYTWRGADLDQILDFPKRHPNTTIYKIETNYRSSPQILKLANDILESRSIDRSYTKILKPSRPNENLPVFVPAIDAYQQADYVLNRIDRLIDRGARYSDIAILYRAHFHAMDIQMELSRRGTPFVITSGIRFFEQAHVKDLVSQLRFIVNPKDLPAFHRFACLLPKIGEKTASKILHLAETVSSKNNITMVEALATEAVSKKIPADAEEDWDALVETLQAVDEAARTSPPVKVVDLAVNGWYADFIRYTYDNWAHREEDLESLIEFASRYDNLSEMLAELILLSSESGNRVTRSGESCLRLSTIHQAKGLEFPYVFIIGLADGLFPIKRAIDGEGDLEEERRLFYVAATRAEKELFMIFPMLSHQKGTPVRMQLSRFIRELSESHYEVEKPAPSYRSQGNYGRGNQGYGGKPKYGGGWARRRS
ncbi:MAG: ATP-dependent helicase [Opitutales bacterium]